MTNFCFIIPRTPVAYRTPLREFLWQTCLFSLRSQQNKNWVAIVIGLNENLNDDRFIFLEQDLIPKRNKVEQALEWLNKQTDKPDFLIRLDDDDIISSTLLNNPITPETDGITDNYHCFMEVSSGRISRQKRPWFPNTMLHRFDYAVKTVETPQYKGPLICQDHSMEWHTFYADKKIQYTNKNSPLYLRILSPDSITSRAADDKQKAGTQYLNYLLQFGDWMTGESDINGFEQSVPFFMDGLNAADKFGLPVVKWPVVKLWKNKWLSLKQDLLR